MPKRSCGSCTLCCKTMGVSDLLPEPKPPNRWCDLCAIGSGCKVYADRPQTCRDFACIWLQDTQGLFPDDCRPDRIGVVFVTDADGCGLIAHCDPATPTAWRNPKALDRLKASARAGFRTGARAGLRNWVITAKTEWEAPEECVRRGPHGQVDIHISRKVQIEIGYLRAETVTR